MWLWDPRWPELIHPHASAIDTPLPRPPEVVEAALAYAATWVDVPIGKGHVRCQRMAEGVAEGVASAAGVVLAEASHIPQAHQ